VSFTIFHNVQLIDWVAYICGYASSRCYVSLNNYLVIIVFLYHLFHGRLRVLSCHQGGHKHKKRVANITKVSTWSL